MTEREIPLYTQTAGFSCGAACLAMALAALDGDEPGRALEFELWRQATMIGIRGIDQWGLALPPATRGHPVTVVTEAEQTFPRWEPGELAALRQEQAEAYPGEELPTFSEEDLEVAWWAQQDNRRRAQAAGVAWERRPPSRQDVTSAIEQGAVPILLVDLELLGGHWPAPHWVVAAGRKGQAFQVHDPDEAGPGHRQLSWEELSATMDVSTYRAEPTIVVVGPWTPPDPS